MSHPGSQRCSPQLIDGRQVELATGIPLATLRQWTARGKLRPVRHGRVTLYDLGAVMRVHDAHRERGLGLRRADRALRRLLDTPPEHQSPRKP